MYEIQEQVSTSESTALIECSNQCQLVCQQTESAKLVLQGSHEAGNPGGLLKPSINTIGREAFTWFVGPHLTFKREASAPGLLGLSPPLQSSHAEPRSTQSRKAGSSLEDRGRAMGLDGIHTAHPMAILSLLSSKP